MSDTEEEGVDEFARPRIYETGVRPIVAAQALQQSFPNDTAYLAAIKRSIAESMREGVSTDE